MNKESKYWKWKSLIIDFANLTNEKNDYGEYIKKKDMVFAYLGTPDEEIHEWYYGKYSSEYNEAFRYAKQLNLIEEYIDYDDLLFEKDNEIERLNNILNELKEYLKLEIAEWQDVDNISTRARVEEDKDILDKIKELENSGSDE